MFCSKCGKQLPDNSEFCGYCGSPQKKVAMDTLSESADKTGSYLENVQTEVVRTENTQTEIKITEKVQNTEGLVKCPYCMSIISSEAVICPNCRKKLTKNTNVLRLGLIAVAAVLVILVCAKLLKKADPTNEIKTAYTEIFTDLKNGEYHGSDTTRVFSGSDIVSDYTKESYWDDINNKYNNFLNISSDDIDRIWNIGMENYSFEITSVEETADEEYLVTVELSNRDVYKSLSMALNTFMSTADTKGADGFDIINGITAGNAAGIINGGGILGAIGGMAATKQSIDNAYAGYEAYKSGLKSGANANQIVNIYANIMSDSSYGSNKNTIQFYATKDSEGNWCIPDLLCGDVLASVEIYDGILGFKK